MNRRGAEAQSLNEISEKIIGCAIEIHRAVGPGLLESAYEECMCHELGEAGLRYARQVELPLIYKSVRLNCGYRMDLVVEDAVVIELKTVDRLQPVHDAQLLTYLKLAGYSVGLLINFNVPLLKSGIKRIVNNYKDFSASQRLCGKHT